MDLVSLLKSVIEQSTPILLAGLAAMITLRANILNVAVEGMMLAAAFAAIAVGGPTRQCLARPAGRDRGRSGAVASAGRGDAPLLGRFHRRRAGHQPALGRRHAVHPGTLLQQPGRPAADHVPGHLAHPGRQPIIPPIVGPAFEGQSLIVVLGLLAVPLCALFLYRTPTGTNLRAAGEDEAAARSAGIRIGAMKALSLAISGVLAGLAGAQLAMDKLHFFLPDMTSGRGFIGLAATLFGGGLPWVTAAASFLFGFFGALGDRLQAFAIPSQFVLMLPYVAAIVGLVAARWRVLVRNRPAKLSEARR